MAHCNTILNQLASFFPRHDFENLAYKHHRGQKFRSFSRWSQFLVMMIAQLTGRKSLRKKIIFVTRLKTNSKAYAYGNARKPDSPAVISDQKIKLPGYTYTFRRIHYIDPETGNEYQFLTNSTKLKASKVAAIYKERWKIELFSKWIKQNLKVKTFLGTSENAVLTQLWIALCLYLLLAYLKFQAKLGLSLVGILRVVVPT